MALSYDAMPVRVTVHYQDFNGVKAGHWTQLLYGLTKAQIEPFALSLCQFVERLTDCEVTGVSVGVILKTENARAASPDGDSAQTGVFIVESQTPDDRYIFALPGIKSDKLVSTAPWAGINIDLMDAEVAALVDLLVLGDGTTAPISYALNDLYQVKAAYLQYR